MIRDRLSWMRFLGFDLGGPTPDENTIRLFRDKLTTSRALKRVIKGLRLATPEEGVHPDGGSDRRGQRHRHHRRRYRARDCSLAVEIRLRFDMIRNILAIILLTSAPMARADVEDAKAARVMWSAFMCSVYAEMKGDAAEQARLFQVGYDAGQRFMKAVQAGTITDEEAQSNVPIGVGFLMGGASADFIIGRTFESAAGDAYDDVVKEDASGMPLPMDQWVNDSELKSAIAANRYLKGNCEIM